MILPLFRYILMAAVRDRLFLSLAGILIVVMCLSVFFGASTVTEQDKFALAFAAFGLRLFGVFSLVLFVVNHIRRSFENRDIEYLLSRPMGRVQFVLTHAAAFSFLALMAAILFGGVVMALGKGAAQGGMILWWVSLAAEFVIMANIAMFFAFVMNSATACSVIVLCFYLLARLIGEILGILHARPEIGIFSLLAKIMEFISIFIPRLDLMGQTKWILYGVPAEVSFPFILAQCAVFTSLVIAATVVDMRKRQF